MIKKVLHVFALVFITAWLTWLKSNTDFAYGGNLQESFFSFTILYLIFNVVIDGLIDKHISGHKARFRYKRTSFISESILFLLIMLTVWAQSVQALFVAYGLVAAGVTLALQDMFKNLAGGLILLTRSIYTVGDRIEVDNITGDVIDIGILNTTILEINNWVQADQATGRLILIPNGLVLNKTVFNYTKDNLILWDELMIPITHKSDWKKAQRIFTKITQNLTKEYQEIAEIEISKLSKKYYLDTRDAKAVVYLKPTDNWLELHIRYVTLARERRETISRLYELLWEKISSEKDIEMASTTLDIIGFPHK